MDISTIDPDCLPEVLSMVALAHACEFLEMYSGMDMGDWRYYFNQQAVETLGDLPEDQIEKLINEEFIKEGTVLKIHKVQYSALFNTGNYSNERISMSATLDEGETPETVIEELKDRVTAIAGPDPQKVRQALTDARYELEKVLTRIEEAQKDWNTLADFLRAQGIKPEIGTAPVFKKLLPMSRANDSDVFIGEIEHTDYMNQDDDDDD